MSDEENLDKWFNLLPLILRLMTSAERGFHKSLTELRRLQKARGFVPQNASTHAAASEQRADIDPGFVSHAQTEPRPKEAVAASAECGFLSQNRTDAVTHNSFVSQNSPSRARVFATPLPSANDLFISHNEQLAEPVNPSLK
ncbi:MAG: hypothetical protein JOZ62_19550 [Acidobacteriaceae bacterium]|nr:hypothetical protein [Acidobacteriaceae bacterium]